MKKISNWRWALKDLEAGGTDLDKKTDSFKQMIERVRKHIPMCQCSPTPCGRYRTPIPTCGAA